MRPDREDGFSLIELIMVVTVIGILLAIAVPTFASAGDRAGRRAAEADLHTAATAALILSTEAGGTFLVDDTPISAADLHAEEPALEFDTVATVDTIGVDVDADGETLLLSTYDRRGNLLQLLVDAGRNLVSEVEEVDESDQDGSGANGNGNGNGNGGNGNGNGNGNNAGNGNGNGNGGNGRGSSNAG